MRLGRVQRDVLIYIYTHRSWTDSPAIGVSFNQSLYQDKQTMKRLMELKLLRRLRCKEAFASWRYCLTKRGRMIAEEIIRNRGHA